MKNANCWFHGLVTLVLLYTSLREFAVVHAAEEQVVTINTAKWAQIISDRFLSITIDPETLLLGKDTISDTTRILKLARSLAPSYFRIAGSSVDQYHFENILSKDEVLNNKTVTESQWIRLNDFAREAGFDVIVCLSALQRLNGIWDPRNALDLISFSDKMGYKIDWELGYELQKLDGKISAEQLAMDVNRLRNILNSFSYYKHSIIVGPDITNLYTKKDIDFLRNFIQEAGSSLDAITWHPKYLSSSSCSTTGEELDYMFERLIFEREGLAKMLGRQFARKPIWIAESHNYTNCGNFIHALNWAQELGSFAGIGIQTVMKQPNLQQLLEIPPTYWVSLLHKALVGQVVLDVRHNSANNTNVPVFCHCTNTMKNNKASELIITDNKYEPGAITFFALNRRASEVNLTVKLTSGMKQDNMELHQYLLSADHRVSDPLLSRNVLLNGKLLTLEDTGNLPELSPSIEHTGWNLTVSLPPSSIGFWVIPRANVKLCVSSSKKAIPLKIDVQSQSVMKPISVGNYISSYGSRNSETFGRDLKYGDNAGASKHETNKEYHVDENKTKTFKHKKHHGLKSKKVLEKKTQEFRHLATVNENEAGSLHVSKNKEAFVDKNSDQPSRSTVEKLELEAHANYTGNISTERKSSLERLKRYVPENNNAMPFSGLPLDMFPQSSLSGRSSKTRRKKKAELKSDKKEDREVRKDKLKQKDDNFQATLFDPFFSSIENGGHCFHHMKREDNEIRSFPSGDIYLKQGDSSEEQRNNDYDYVDKDEKEYREHEDEADDIEAADIELNLKPGEFFETIRGSKEKINENFVGYGGELWEAETFTMATPTEKMEDIAVDEDAYDQEVIREKGPTEEEDRKQKAAAVNLLNLYLTEGYAEKQSEESKHKDKSSKKARIQRKTERKEEYSQDLDDYSSYFITDHKDKPKNIPEKPTHHHHHHHHITGHSKPTKEGKLIHYDHAHNVHNHKDKTRKLANHNEKHLFSDEDDIFFPHINHEKEKDYRRNHAYHRSPHSSEEKIEPVVRNSHKGREKAVQSSQVKNDALLLNNEHFEGSSTPTKSPRQSRTRKINHKVEEAGNTNGKSKHDLKTSENERDNNLSRMYEESSENRKVTHQNEKQERKKYNKPSISEGSKDHTHQEKDAHNEKKKSKDKEKYSNHVHNNKYEIKDKNSEALDSRSTESNTKISKKKVQVMDATDSFEDDSQMNSGEVIEDENEEHELDPYSAESADKRITSANHKKSNHKIAVRSSSENFEDAKIKGSKNKEKSTNHRIESVKVNSSAVSSNYNEKVGHRKPKRIENISEDVTIKDHVTKKGVSSRKSSQLHDYSNEEITEKKELASKSSMKTQDSKHKSEKVNKNKQWSQEISLEQETDTTPSTEENSLEHSNKMETILEDAHENLSIGSSHPEIETKNEPLSNEDLSNEDISDQHNHNMQSQQKNLNVSKYKMKAKHISEEYTLEDNTSDIQGESKKRHTSSEHYTEANKELTSEVGKSEEMESMREKPRTPNDENNEKSSKEKETKRKNGKHRTTKNNDLHNRARRDTFALLTNDNNNTSLNHSYSSESSNKEMSPDEKTELLSDSDLGFDQNEVQHLIDSANTFIGNIIADDIDVKLESNMFIVPQQYVENEEYLAQDILGHNSYGDIVSEDISQENSHSSKIAEYNPEDDNFSNTGTESQTEYWTFRSDNSIQIFNEEDTDALIRENNAKREVNSKTFENAVVQSTLNKGEDKEPVIYNSSPYQENMNSNQDKESSTMIKDDEENNRQILLQSPVDAGDIPTKHVIEKVYMQDGHFSESISNEKDLSKEENIFYLPESSLKVNHDPPIKNSEEGKSARNILISEESELQNLLEKNVNEELSKEELLYSEEKSNEMKQLTLELKSGADQYIRENEHEDIAMKSVAAPEYVDHLTIYFSTTEPTNSLHNEGQQNSESLFAAEVEKEELYDEKTSEEHDNNKDTENNEHIVSKYQPSISEDVQSERVPKAIMYVVEDTSNIDKIVGSNYEGTHILNPAEETRNNDDGLEMISTAENTEKHNIPQSSSKELTRNIELLDVATTTLYDQEHSVQDSITAEPVSLSSLSPDTNLHGNDAPTKVSLVSVNEETRNSEPSSMSANVSKEIAPSERSSSGNDVKKIKITKPLTLPKKNTDRLKLEQKYKERIQQLKERRAKIKAGLFKKPDAIQLKKSDNVSTNKKIRKRRSVDEENSPTKSSVQELINVETLSDQLNTNIFYSSSDSQDGKSLSDPALLWVTEDYDTDDSSEEQLHNFKLFQKSQHMTPNLWNTDIFVTPSHIVTESIGIFDHYAPRNIEQRSTEFSDTVSVPVTLHKTLLITENNPYYSEEEAVGDETEKDLANNELISEEVLVKLTAPLINYEPFNHLQQGTTYFHKIIPIHENDIDILKNINSIAFESGNTEVKEELDIDRFPRYVSSVIGDVNSKNNFQSLSFAEPSNVKENSNDNIVILKDLLHNYEQNKMDILSPFPDDIQDSIAIYETDNNKFTEDTSSESGRDIRKEVMLTSGINDTDNGLLFPNLEAIADIQAAEDNDDALINEDAKSEEQTMIAVRSKRALKTDYDPLNDDLLWPFIVPIMPENEKSLDAFLNKIDSQQVKKINNNADTLQVISSESDTKKEINEHQIMNENQSGLTPQSILGKLFSPRNVNDKIFRSNSMNQISTTPEKVDDIKADAASMKGNLFNILHPNSLDFHILNFGEKEAGYNSERNELNAIEAFNEVEGKPFYKNMDLETNDYINTVNSKDRIKYLHSNLQSYSPVKKMIEKYAKKKSRPNSIYVDAESSPKDKEIAESNNSSEYDREDSNSKQVLGRKINLLNGSHLKYYANPKEELSVMLNLYLENSTNNVLNNTSSSDIDGKHGNAFHPKVTTEGNTLMYDKPAKASIKGKRENLKRNVDSQLGGFRSIIQTLTDIVTGFLHQLSPWKTAAD